MKMKPKKKIAAQQVVAIPDDFEITPDFEHAFDVMEHTNRHVYITGKAGTGKSTLLQYFKEKTKKKIVVLAPTGVAAINVGGSTIHSFFRFPPRLVTKHEVRRVRGKEEVFAALETVVIDEVSMVRADVMDAIDHSLRLNRKRPNQPFGGVQVICIGDLYQLPPIVERELQDYFQDTYESPYFFDAQVFKEHPFETIELGKVFRQRDPGFIELLNKVRNNQIRAADLLKLNQRCAPSAGCETGELAITLTSTNGRASQINLERLEALRTKECVFDAIVTGNFDEQSCPTEKRLKLKPGAQVMMVKNDPNKRWVNGSLGVVQKLSRDSITVSFGDAVCAVEPSEWEKTEYEYNKADGRIQPMATGSFRQYPIKLAWAITVHKSQGKTFDKVIIDLGHGAFAHGQTYVALSRCRSFEGIRLKSPIKYSDIILDGTVSQFHDVPRGGAYAEPSARDYDDDQWAR
jgi:ATP-dependent DNA helicase PIF1